jgi:predicted ATPase
LSGVILRGWLMAMDGDAARGVELMRRSIEERSALGAAWYQTRYLCMLAEICLANNERSEGLGLIATAKRHMELHDEQIWEAEAHRLEGELLRLPGGDGDRAERCLLNALSTARRQGAKSLELRAATSLARFWGDKGQAEPARRELAPVVGWFTEGLDTPDVRLACSVLDRLAGLGG